jgi:hypothetical protein
VNGQEEIRSEHWAFSCSILVFLKVESFTLYTFDSSTNHSKHLKIKRIDQVSFGITFAALSSPRKTKIVVMLTI